jgi:small subunit ribosomal protein S6
MNHYETVFILTPVLSDAQVKETVDGIKAELEGNGAAIINEEAWGMRKLAYSIEEIYRLLLPRGVRWRARYR